MDLLEYQAKLLFREAGIPVLLSQRIDRPEDLKGLKVPYPVVLKSQVRSGGRGKAGGIKFVENTIDAVAAAQTIFGLPINGEYPDVLLAEAKFAARQEFYLAVMLDRQVRRPVLLGSQAGGIEIESLSDQIQQVVVEDEFSSFYARRLALRMGLTGDQIQSVSLILEKMYGLFASEDLDLIEINPLGVSESGQIMALDGKVSVNDDALNRHPDLLCLKPAARAGDREDEARSLGLQLVTLNGNVGVLCNGAGLTMATMDLINLQGGKPANFLDVGGGAGRERIERGLELVAQDKNVRVLLVNILGGITSCDEVAAAVEAYRSRLMREQVKDAPQLIVRLQGNDMDKARERMAASGLPLLETLDEAVDIAVAATASARPLKK
ncbi:succinate--CoA ligase subunit beta [Leptolyngbya sp. FACHB-261]|uniref:succinate--CoA ligase subunit beta n=1 Tax=Leptolyngbya sp. FACHB-261 TaxID=2692806 RepID=UPI00168A2AFC|nr:succinate--CoA ligase subunit beta [Leptolyngbya sp. FACHB-261]MBD2100499.1 succinate--CoA ligase subunit beta [Leptolyngbya sp. FACHB-261]